VIDVNLTGTLRVTLALRAALAAARGCVINVASMHSFFGSPHVPAYGASKAAIVQLTKSLALQWANDGIRVNAIAPGWIKTELSRKSRENEEFSQRLQQRYAAARWADPEEVAGPVVFLASPAARLISGTTLVIDGGYSAA
jgi:NAD(P)-dependent dehydrogenase (short-subunit alcohol dehydrogenase family)